jgi:hydrogenase maturation protease
VPHRRWLVLGLGNDIITDDAVGLLAVREARARLAGVPEITVWESGEMGLALLDLVAGFEGVLLVDAVQTGKAPPGFIHEFDADDLKVLPTVSPHFVGVGEALALGRELGLAVPQQVRILAIEVQDALTLGTGLTPPLQAALGGVVERVVVVARRMARAEAGASSDA